MIYTVTFNPSLDYIVSVDDFRLGMTNRTASELTLPGGKGINVSIVLSNLGIDSTALGFIAGYTGDEIKKMLCKMGINTNFINVLNGTSRINVKIKNIDGTEINGMGPDISEQDIENLIEKIQMINDKDVLVLAGSIPVCISDEIYSTIMKRLHHKNVMVVVDAESSLLLNVLKYNPFLIKPNHHELGQIFGVELREKKEVVPYAVKLQEQGARNVLVSMGADGAVLVTEAGDVYEAASPKGILKNSVGAGDSMVAGFIAGWLKSHNYAYAFGAGVAAGSASAFSEYLATKQEIEDLLKKVNINKLK